MQIKDILGIYDARLLIGNELDFINEITKDTRKINGEDTYLALKGENFDGNSFYEDALLKGVKTCILSDASIIKEDLNKYKDKNIILVDDTEQFILELGKKKREEINVPIIAVTGSVGKTSTRNIIADILSCKFKVLRAKGNLNTPVGQALTFLRYQDEDIIVLEMGMNHFGEIRELSLQAKPDVAVITNIGTAHIGNLGSRENILKAKMEIIEGLKGPLIINNDNDLLNDWLKNNKTKLEVITYGIDESGMYQAKNITYDKFGSHFTLNEEKIDINVIGKHFIYNALVAFAIADIYKISHTDVKEKLKNIPLEENRMQLIHCNQVTIINDTYNASYDSIYYALEVLSFFKGRTIAVLGDIFELGDFAEEIHRKIGFLIKKYKVDILITLGENAKYINDEAIKEGFDHKNSFHFNSNKEASTFIKKIKNIGDTILVKASNGMHFIEIVNYLKEKN